MTLAELKIELLKEIMNLESEEAIKKIYRTVQNFASKQKNKELKNEKISFEEWNRQFTDNQDIDEYIEEYGMSLREYRQTIYEAETDDDEIDFEELLQEIKKW
jgi:replication initiation and membrane attachment protein DnaB